MNFKVRARNPLFYVMILGAILLPILSYMNLELKDLTTWGQVGKVFMVCITNPYVLGTVAWSVFIALVDPTTHGFKDSTQAMKYLKPKKTK